MSAFSTFAASARPLLVFYLVFCALLVSVMPAHTQAPAPATPPAPGTSPTTGQNLPATPSSKRRLPLIGVDAGVFLPSSGKVQNQFGSSWLDVGPGIGKVDAVRAGGGFYPDIHLLTSSHDGNRAYVAPLGVVYRRALTNGAASRLPFTPYVSASADVVPADMRSVPDNVHYGLQVGYGGSVGVGLAFGDRALVSAKYQAITSIQDFNLSGWRLDLSIRF